MIMITFLISFLMLTYISLLCFFFPQKGALIEELNRVSAENKKLTEMLTVMCENYTELRNQLLEHTSKNTGVESNTTASRKRKAESSNNINGNNIDHHQVLNLGPSESSSSDEESSKKPREEHIKAKISRVCVRTEASDTSLVSDLAKTLFSFLEILCGNLD